MVRTMVPSVALALASSLLLLHPSARLQPDAPIRCDDCAEWNAPRAPAKVFGNTYSVGVAGLSSVLIASPRGLILLDGGLPQSAPLIDANIRSLGFRTEDIKLIVNSHAHFDHAGGIAALQRFTGATVAASSEGARGLERGEPVPEDPQAGFGKSANAFPPVKQVRVVKDGETLRIGSLAITAHLTPGHTPGGTTWSWRSCEGKVCKEIVYADSMTPVSAPGFRFSGDHGHPGAVEGFRRSLAKIAALPCDILLAPHPATAEGKTCATYAAAAGKRLEQRIAEEK